MLFLSRVTKYMFAIDTMLFLKQYFIFKLYWLLKIIKNHTLNEFNFSWPRYNIKWLSKIYYLVQITYLSRVQFSMTNESNQSITNRVPFNKTCIQFIRSTQINLNSYVVSIGLFTINYIVTNVLIYLCH